MFRFRMILADDVDMDFWEDEGEPEWEDASCEDPYWEEDEEDEEDDVDWCD
jgi:hypothetical protein